MRSFCGLCLSAVLGIALLSKDVNSFAPSIGITSTVASRSTTKVFNVPPPTQDDAVALKEYASRQAPPASFFALQQDCQNAAKYAINDGHRLLEVEFPPLPANVLEMDDVSAYEVSQANLNLALDFCKGMLGSTMSREEEDAHKTIKKISILFPDESEAKIAVDKMTQSANPYPGITISSLRKSEEGDDRIVKPEQLFLNLFGGGSGGAVKAMEDVDMYVILTASAQELPDIEELNELENGEKPIVFYNLKLDVLRGDLGAPAFPPKEFQDRFLSRVKPVYYLRTRQYSRSTPNPPFLVNFQGCLFRTYPGTYQTLLDTGTGRYRRLVSNEIRPGLGEFKEQLTDALKKQGILAEEGKTISFLRTGYKTTTWWEEEREDASDAWRT